jgi:ribosomal protein L16 Arg81 hydroxylase
MAPYNINGTHKDDIAIQCTGKGYLPWTLENGDMLYIPCYYSPNKAETILSPTDAVFAHIKI